MKTLAYAATLSAAMLIAGTASAQIAGGLTGQVGGNVGVSVPQPGPIVSGVGSTVRDAGRMTRDTVRDARDIAVDARPEVNVNANARAGARADRDGASVDAALKTGAMVHSSDGAMLGSVVDVARNSVGRATSFVVRTTDGATRTIPAGSVSVDGDAVVTAWTESQFNAQPR